MDWFKNNIETIRDLITSLSAAGLLALAILAYLRAKETILQPFRSEVLKRQADILSKLFDFASKSQTGEDDAIDYQGLCFVNSFNWLEEYGFQMHNQEQIDKQINELSGGILWVGEGKILPDFEVVEPFVYLDKKVDDGTDRKKNRYEKAKSGKVADVIIDKIFLTKKFDDYIHELDEYIKNPFLPSSISEILTKLRSDIYHNIRISIRQTIAEFIAEFMRLYIKSDSPHEINPIGVYNNFNRRRLNHKEVILSLRYNIRRYLKVDTIP